MKKITIVTSYPINSEPVIKNRLQPYIDVLVRNGFTIILISGDVENPAFSFGHKISSFFIPKPDVQGKSFFARALAEFEHAGQLLQLANSKSTSCIILTIPSMFLLFRSSLLSHYNKIIDVRDLTWEYLSNDKVIFLLIKKIFSWLAKYKLRYFSLIAVTNLTELSKMEKYYVLNSDKIHLLPNGVSKEQFDVLSKIRKSKSKRPTVCYVGNIGLAQNLTTLIDVAIRYPEADFFIVGNGNDFNRVKQYSEQSNAKNVYLTGRLDWDVIPSYYDRSDILFAQLGIDYQGAMPSKLYEYLATGKFIIYGGGQEAKRILAEFDNNIVINPDSTDALYQALYKAFENVTNKYLSDSNRYIIQSKYIREDNINRFVTKLLDLL